MQQPTNWLSKGDCGVRAELPDRLEPVDGESDAIQMTEPALGVQWMFFFFPGLHMDLAEEHRERQRLDVEGPARAMFEQVHRNTSETGDPPRTADAMWSPMIDIEFDTIAENATALRTVHRMVYRPGTEVIMGHLLVPLEAGLFEARLIATNGDEPTGVRESALMLLQSAEADRGEASMPSLDGDSRERQRGFDDPEHDAKFATHPLSRVRMALYLLQTEYALHIDAPAEPGPLGRIEFDDPICTLVPPPRFFVGDEGLQRVTFCGTDGLQLFIVERLKGASRGKDLEVTGRKHARRLHEESDVADVQLSVSHSQLDAERDLVVIAVDGDGNAGPLRNTMGYFDAADSIWALSITSTLHVAPELIAADLVGTLEPSRQGRQDGASSEFSEAQARTRRAAS